MTCINGLLICLLGGLLIAEARELENCFGDRMIETQCQQRITENQDFCSKNASGNYKFARAYCCKTCVVSLGWTKEGGLPDYEQPDSKAWLQPPGPKEDDGVVENGISLTPWCEMMKNRPELDFCSQAHYALKCKKTCDIVCDN